MYAKWIINEIKRDKTQFASFSKGKGIIATRERFLKWLESSDGKLELENTAEEEIVQVKRDQKKFGKTIIVPVAIPGVGEQTIPLRTMFLTVSDSQARRLSQSHSRISSALDIHKATTYVRRS